ncbi:metalloregulator ArsR/SmtB family transcription factor [Micromonospora trifolii]|uniref:metalloregulator ArsR/SmtB family transcription factor n=1 Tax=Micromonospora trifolii TaxID=2911208 RepID=UPI003CF4FC13
MDEVAVAIADPVRRHILTMLRAESLSAGEIAQRFTISRPAISRHLRVLRDSGLVRDELVGRRRIYRLDPGPLAPLLDWLTALTTVDRWGRHLDALETEVYRTRRERRSRGPAEHRREHTA